MKIKTIITAAALLGSASFAAADDRTFGDGGIPDRIKELADTGGATDEDGNPIPDGEVSEEEWQAFKAARKAEREARREDHRSEWDTDGIPGLSDEEKEAAREAIRAQIEEKRLARFTEADASGDGFLDAGEFAAIPSVAKLAEHHPEKVDAIFARLNTNTEDGPDGADAGISADEFVAHLGHRRPVRPPFERPDPRDHNRPDPRDHRPDPRDPRPGDGGDDEGEGGEG